MIRNLKAFGLALVTVVAVSAVGASGASAQSKQGKLTINNGTEVTLDGTETGVNSITVLGASIECLGSTITGHKITTTPHEAIPVNATEITLTPHLTGCIAIDSIGKHKATVTMTSCDYHFKIGETTGGVPNTYRVTSGTTCNTFGDAIDIEVYAFSGSELGGVQCTIKMKAQASLTGLHLTTNTVNDDLNVNGTATEVHAERSGSACATETTTTASYHVNLTLRGTDTDHNPTGITVTDTAP